MFAYSQIAQQDDEPIVQYFVRAKVLLECMHHTPKLSYISGAGLDNIPHPRSQGHHIRRRVMKEQESWMTM